MDYVAGRNRYMGYLSSLGIYSFKGVKFGLDLSLIHIFDVRLADTGRGPGQL